MVVSGLRLVNFRSYCDATVRFGPGLNVVVGENATGKTNLLEAAWFALRGSSPRTRRDEKLITWGERFGRVELTLDSPDSGAQQVDVGFAPSQGKRVRWGGLEVTSLDDLRGRSQVFIFVPESLLLVKGSPARRRAHLDAFAAALDPQYAAAARDLQGVLRQRNAQLGAVKHGADPAALDPWDVQFARVAAELGRRRRDLVAELSEGYAETAAALAPANERFELRLVAQLEGVGYDEAALLEELRSRRPGEVGRGLSLYGPQRDDLKFLEVGPEQSGVPGRPTTGGDDAAVPDASPLVPAIPTVTGGPVCGPVELPRGGRDLRLFGSQGEQRAAVLALLLAEQRLAAAHTGQQGPLFLDDVMSELDDSRRRLLVRMLATAGQAIITTTNRHYFTDAELAEATVVELPLDGSLAAGEVAPPQDDTAQTGAARAGRAVTGAHDKAGGPGGGGGAGKRRHSGGGVGRDDLPRRLGDIITPSLDKLAGGDEARAYAAWARAVGEPVTAGTRPKAFRRGQLTVECASSVWANELTYLGPQILRRMDEVAPGHPVKRFRFIVGRLPAAADADRAPGTTLPVPSPEADPRSPSQGPGAPAAKKKRRHEQPAPDEHDAARAQAEGVDDGRLRAAIEAALRRSSQEPPTAPGRGTPSG